MVNKILTALAALITLAGTAQAQQRTIYDAGGKVVGRSSTDTQGATTLYDASGKVVGREFKSGNTTTVYDAAGRNLGKVTGGTVR